MDILIVANFVSGMDGNDNNRFTYIANELSKNNDVELVTSDFHHAKKEHRKGDYSALPYKVTLLHECGYSKNVCLKRFRSHKMLGKNVLKYLKNRKKPNILYCAVPSLDVAKACATYAKNNNVKFIIDIQDLWPEAFKMIFNVPLISGLLFRPMENIANQIYAQADEIIAVSKTYCERALKTNEKCFKTHPVFLGTRLVDFDENVINNEPILFSASNKIVLGYCGTLGNSYDLKCVIDAISIIKKRALEVPSFLVMGDGPKKQEFEEYAKEKGIDVAFVGRIPYAKMCASLSSCDIVINPIKKGSAASIINKHADYASCGKPVINTQESKEYCELVENYKMGFNCKPSDALDVAEKLILLMNDSELRISMGKNARRCAEEKFDRENTYQEIYSLINC